MIKFVLAFVFLAATVAATASECDVYCAASLPEIRRELADPHSQYTKRLDSLRAIAKLGSAEDREVLEKLALRGEDDNTKRRAIVAIAQLGLKDSVPVLERLTHDPSSYIRDIAGDVLSYYFGKTRYHRLYRGVGEDAAFFDANQPVTVHEFAKTGSQTYLLGGKLFGKVIIRVIGRKQFKAWEKAYTAETAWKEAGFNYVPVEPYLHREEVDEEFNLDEQSKNTLTALEHKILDHDSEAEVVYTRVLGPNMNTFESMATYDSWKIVMEMRQKIVHVIDDLRILHNHVHPGNFVAGPSSSDKNVKVYLIDFDAALARH